MADKKIQLSRRNFIVTVSLILILDVLLVFFLVGVGLVTYESWGPWFNQRLLGRQPTSEVSASHQDASQQELIRQGDQSSSDKGVVENLASSESVADIVERVNPAVVSIIVTKDLPKVERYYEEYNPFNDSFFEYFFNDSGFEFQVPRYRQNGTQEREIGGGTGFIISNDGMIVTNKHVVADEEAKYTVLLNDGSKIKANVLARDPVNDIAVLKINKQGLTKIDLADSDKIRVGEEVIAIGNALGEYRNTVSTGIISGLKRNITASAGFGQVEQLSGVIQTDAAINPGNSGGPLLDMQGRAIGVNVAMVRGSENIGFALPINDVKRVIESVEKHGRVVRPWIGVRYVMVDRFIQSQDNLPLDYGALILRGESMQELAVIPGSPADKVGLVENDIILEVDGKKIEGNYTLSKAILSHNVGDTVELKVYHRGDQKKVKLKLEERQ